MDRSEVVGLGRVSDRSIRQSCDGKRKGDAEAIDDGTHSAFRLPVSMSGGSWFDVVPTPKSNQHEKVAGPLRFARSTKTPIQGILYFCTMNRTK